jgi:GNAT superfamily N-acetyltransferase
MNKSWREKDFMDSPITVVQASTADFEAAFSLLERFFTEEGFTTSSEQIRVQLAGLLSSRDSAVFLAWQAGQPVGVATVTTTRGLEFGLSAEMEDLYVLPEVRGLGVGRALIGTVNDWCRQQGCSVVAVIVTPEGQAAHDLISYYRGQGFQESGRTTLFYPLTE